MSFSFENQGTHTYLVYTVAEGEVMDSVTVGMLTINKIPGLAHTLFTQMDSTRYVKYDVSARVSVRQFFTGPVNKKRLIGVFRGVVDAVLSAEEYMIEADSIVLDLDYMFADVSTCETVLVCLPVVDDGFGKGDLAAFFKNIMFSTQFDQTENCGYIATIINFLNGSSVFSLENFKKLLDGIEGAAPATEKPPQPVVPERKPAHAEVHNGERSAPKSTLTSSVTANPAQTTSSSVVKDTPAKEDPVPQTNQESSKKKSGFGLFSGLFGGKSDSDEKKKNKNDDIGFPVPGEDGGVDIPGLDRDPAPSAGTSSGGAANGFLHNGHQKADTGMAPSVNSNAASSSEPKSIAGTAGSFGETTVLNGAKSGETTVLSQTPAAQPKPYLVRLKNNERINVGKPSFRIGKERSYVDYFVADNSTISRAHANIITRDGEYFVVDTNSKNHTYVNGQMIQSNVETKITHGTKLKFSNEEYEFRLY